LKNKYAIFSVIAGAIPIPCAIAFYLAVGLAPFMITLSLERIEDYAYCSNYLYY
jgi:hypothetical protein